MWVARQSLFPSSSRKRRSQLPPVLLQCWLRDALGHVPFFSAMLGLTDCLLSCLTTGFLSIESCVSPADNILSLCEPSSFVILSPVYLNHSPLAHLVCVGFLFNEHSMPTYHGHQGRPPYWSYKQTQWLLTCASSSTSGRSDVVLCFSSSLWLREEKCGMTAADSVRNTHTHTLCETRSAKKTRKRTPSWNSHIDFFNCFFAFFFSWFCLAAKNSFDNLPSQFLNHSHRQCDTTLLTSSHCPSWIFSYHCYWLFHCVWFFFPESIGRWFSSALNSYIP